MTSMITHLGPALAIFGSILACYGVWIFNIRKDPTTANLVWAFSNPMLCAWAVGYILQWWNGGILPVGVMAVMWGYYTAASWWGWWKR